MDIIQIATLALGVGFISVVASSIRQRRTLELRARVFELIGTAARRGLPMAPALRRMGTSMGGPNGRALVTLSDRLDEGDPLGTSLAACLPTGTIPAELLATIHASEGTAALQEALEGLASNADQVQRAQDQVATALAYPSLLAVCLVGTYATTDSLLDELPAIASSPSSGFAALATHVVAIVLWGALALALLAQSTGVGGRMHELMFAVARRLPGIGPILYVGAASRVLRVAAGLSASGLPFGDILRRAAHATRHGGVRHGMLRAARAADEGDTPTEVWERSGLPAFAVAFATLAVAATPDQIGQRLRSAARACDRRVERRVSRGLAMIQPAAIAVFGALIAVHFGMVIEHVQSSRFLMPGDAPW